VLIDLPFDVQMAEIEFDHRHLRAAARTSRPPRARSRRPRMLNEAERPLIVAAAA
jgi:glyoxylate carboligase